MLIIVALWLVEVVLSMPIVRVLAPIVVVMPVPSCRSGGVNCCSARDYDHRNVARIRDNGNVTCCNAHTDGRTNH